MRFHQRSSKGDQPKRLKLTRDYFYSMEAYKLSKEKNVFFFTTQGFILE
jgi:hypothetical protein